MVVGAQQNDHVLQRHHQQQRPDDQREDSEHDLVARRISGADRREYGFMHGIEGTRSDVAIDDADGTEGQSPEPRMLLTSDRMRVLNRCFRLIGTVYRHGFHIPLNVGPNHSRCTACIGFT